jgi:PAS domain S-box-containing protein
MKFVRELSTLGFAMALVLMGALGISSYHAINQQLATAKWAEHSQLGLDQLQTLLREVERAPAEVRGYLLTRDDTFRQALAQVRVEMPQQIDSFARLTADNPSRRADVPALGQAITIYLDALDHEVDSFNSAQTVVPDLRRNGGLLSAVEKRVEAIGADERVLLKQRQELARSVSARSELVIEIGSSCAVVIVLLSFFLAARATRARWRVEQVLRESEQRFRFMVGSIEDYAVVMLDARGNVMSWNSGAERMKGYRATEIIGKHFSLFYPDEQVRAGVPEKMLRETVARGRSEDEGLRVRADGSTFLANVRVNAVHDEAGRLLGFVKVTSDATESKEAERCIQRLNEDLAQRASQLEVSNKELEAFSYSVSHDLRSPLRHIAGFVEMLQKSKAIEGDPESRRHLGIVARAAELMGRLIDDLLDFSRTSRSEMRLGSTDMRAIVDEVLGELGPEAAGRKLTWDIRPLDAVVCDPHLMRLVWTNLISNALKYTRPGEHARIEIGQECGAGGAGSASTEVCYYVRDNGVGFNMEYAHKLFGVFQRLHRADEFEGTGIGLANVQRIVHRHGGHVWAEGNVDRGSIFSFSLPITGKEKTTCLCQN